MRAARESLFHLLEPLLPLVERPSRYINHEWGAITGREADTRCCLIYPDVYEVGQSNLGLAILYDELNREQGIACERAYVPWPDMADLMRAHDVPLLSLEQAYPLASFDIVGFTLAHELACTNILEALDLGRIPLRAAERAQDDPIVIAGGPSVWNCEPVAPVFDAVLLGDGERAIGAMARCVRDARAQGVGRAEILRRLAALPGVYVPSHYELAYGSDGTRWGYAVPVREDVPAVVRKHVITDFASTRPLPSSIIPFGETVFDRLSLEILRGCTRGCRFCQAGITYRPVRERPADQVVASVVKGLEESGYGEVSLTSLSTTDHSQCAEMLRRLNARLDGTGTRVSIPSQRLDSFGFEMAVEAAGEKRGGITFAVEAGSQRLRDVINKNVTEQDLLSATHNAFSLGWRRMKLYFMIGLPTETDDDVRAIGELAERVLECARAAVAPNQRGNVSVTCSVGTFVPKSHTPFQWQGQVPADEIRRRQQLLVSSVRSKAVRVTYPDPRSSAIDSFLSRSGRAAYEVVEGAWRRGARFDAWSDCFAYDAWLEAARSCGYELEEVVCSDYALDARLPWDHTSPGESKGFLQREWRYACAAKTTEDCTRSSCQGCGVCPSLGTHNVIVGER